MQDVIELQKRIHPYINQINDEFGEMVNYIYKLLSYTDYINDEFKQALINECSEIAEVLERDYVWVERTETVNIKELVYKDDVI